jgi:HlyD family secretion protein
MISRNSKLLLPLLPMAALAIAAISFFARAEHGAGQQPKPLSSAHNQASAPIGCMGRIEPEDGVIRVTAPYVDGSPAVVQDLRVKENGRVTKGTVIALLHGRDILEATVREAATKVDAARVKLEQVKATPSAADIEARQTEIRRLELELDHARIELRRFEVLRKTDDVSAVELEERRIAAVTAERSLEEANQKLHGIKEARTKAVDLAEAELKVAIATEQRAAAGRTATVVRSPANGLVLKIHAHPGEQIGSDGLLELGKVDRMYVVAEVYETDSRRVHVGQHAAITGGILAHELAGTVERVGSSIAKSQLFPSDPTTFADTRVVPVYIRLQDPAAAAGLIHGKVSVTIRP